MGKYLYSIYKRAKKQIFFVLRQIDERTLIERTKIDKKTTKNSNKEKQLYYGNLLANICCEKLIFSIQI